MKNIRLLKAGDDMKTITRAKYLDRIIELNDTPDIKIITGIRRSGKSKLMQAYIEYLKSHFENINIIFIDFMDLAYEEIKEYHALHAYVEEHYQESKTNYLFVDEGRCAPSLSWQSIAYTLREIRHLCNRLQCFPVECGSGNSVYRTLY